MLHAPPLFLDLRVCAKPSGKQSDRKAAQTGARKSIAKLPVIF
jgi:hypothetical protein